MVGMEKRFVFIVTDVISLIMIVSNCYEIL